jgi:hypothetical protein
MHDDANISGAASVFDRIRTEVGKCCGLNGKQLFEL